MSKKHIGSSLGSFLDEMKIREETELLAIKKTLSLQLRQAMKRRSVSKSRLAKEYAGARAAQYSGGVFFIRFGDGVPPADLARLLRDFALKEYSNEPIEDQCRRALASFRSFVSRSWRRSSSVVTFPQQRAPSC